MKHEECYADKLNEIIKENCDIIRRGYSFARKYEKCLVEIENIKLFVHTQTIKKQSLDVERNTCSDSVAILKQVITNTDSEIERVKSAIKHYNEKISRVGNDFTCTPCCLSFEDDLKLLQRILASDLQNKIKHANSIRSMQTGFDSLHQFEMDYYSEWTEFQIE